MTIAVDLGRKATKTNKTKSAYIPAIFTVPILELEQVSSFDSLIMIINELMELPIVYTVKPV